MVRYIILLSLTILTSTLFAQTLSQSIVFEERAHDFGTIQEKNGKVSYQFVFHNKGKTPVIIDEIHSGCGCIGRVLSTTPVKPGAKGVITIIFNPAYKSGFFSKEIMVFSNKGQNFNRIWVKGNVIPSEHPIEDDYPYNFGDGLYLRLKVIAFGYLRAGETKQVELNYANTTNQQMILSFVVEGNKKGLKFQNPVRIAPKSKGVMTFSYTMPYLGGGDLNYILNPYVNNKKLNNNLEVRILKQNR